MAREAKGHLVEGRQQRDAEAAIALTCVVTYAQRADTAVHRRGRSVRSNWRFAPPRQTLLPAAFGCLIAVCRPSASCPRAALSGARPTWRSDGARGAKSILVQARGLEKLPLLWALGSGTPERRLLAWHRRVQQRSRASIALQSV